MAISDTIKKGMIRAPHRSLLRATGVLKTDSDFDKPFIAVCNSFVQIIPGHAHLDVVGKKVREAIYAAGGIPFEFNTIGVDDGIAMGHVWHEIQPRQSRVDRRLRRDHASRPLL